MNILISNLIKKIIKEEYEDEIPDIPVDINKSLLELQPVVDAKANANTVTKQDNCFFNMNATLIFVDLIRYYFFIFVACAAIFSSSFMALSKAGV